MVLSLKTWKSRSLPVLPRTNIPHHDDRHSEKRPSARAAVLFLELRSKNGKAAARETGGGFFLVLNFLALLRLPRQPQRGDAAAEGFRLFGEQPPGQPRRGFQMRGAPRCDHRRQPRTPWRQRLVRVRETG